MEALSKKNRQHLILEVLRENGAQSQAELLRELERRGAASSQITVSRDLRELGVAKVASGTGRRYALAAEASAQADTTRLKRVLREFARSIEAAGQFIVIKTPPSGAQPVGLALDQADLPEVAGTIAGDDTIFILLRHASKTAALLAHLKSLAV